MVRENLEIGFSIYPMMSNGFIKIGIFIMYVISRLFESRLQVHYQIVSALNIRQSSYTYTQIIYVIQR